jgi:hypothetical protein
MSFKVGDKVIFIGKFFLEKNSVHTVVDARPDNLIRIDNSGYFFGSQDFVIYSSLLKELL